MFSEWSTVNLNYSALLPEIILSVTGIMIMLDRPFQVWRHTVGAAPESDTLVYEETDEAFYVGLSKSRSRRAILTPTWTFSIVRMGPFASARASCCRMTQHT